MQPGGSTSARRPNRSFLWFFALLALGAAFAVAVPIVYNLNQQLKPEQFDAARARWREHGPRDYDLDWLQKTDRQPQPDEYHAKVRGGDAVAVFVNNELLLSHELAAPLGAAAGLGVT